MISMLLYLGSASMTQAIGQNLGKVKRKYFTIHIRIMILLIMRFYPWAIN